ncbi:hypothetical protein EJD97_002734, partial [Solanum chilense]
EKTEKEGEKSNKNDKVNMKKDKENRTYNNNLERTPNSKNKPSKQKRDAAKKRQSKQHKGENENEQEKREEPCKKFIMVNDNQGLDIPPQQAQYRTPPPTEPPDKRQQFFQVNIAPLIDEYAVDDSEDDFDKDNQSLQDPDDVDETSEALIKAFIPFNDQTLEDEIQQETQDQGLSPRGLKHDIFHFEQ